MLFGHSRPREGHELYISDKDFVPLKTGIPDLRIMKYGPKHILEADLYEPLYISRKYSRRMPQKRGRESGSSRKSDE